MALPTRKRRRASLLRKMRKVRKHPQSMRRIRILCKASLRARGQFFWSWTKSPNVRKETNFFGLTMVSLPLRPSDKTSKILNR
jgi:hypothetical protein